MRSSLSGRSGAARLRFSKTVSESSSALTRWSSSPILSAPTLTVPSIGIFAPQIKSISVDFPVPFAP